MRLCCWVDRTDSPQQFQLGQIRRSGLPRLEHQGAVEDLSIPEDSGLVEAVHIVCFDDNILGSEFNFYGPRVSRLSRYLHAKSRGLCPEISLEPLLRNDAADALGRLRGLRLFHLKIRASYIARMTEADETLGQAFKAARDVGGADELEVVLRPRKYSRGLLDARLLSVVRRLARQPELRTEASKFQLKGVTDDAGSVEFVDMLRAQFVSQKRIVRQSARGRALRSDSAYEAIREAYDELKEELLEATAVVP